MDNLKYEELKAIYKIKRLSSYKKLIKEDYYRDEDKDFFIKAANDSYNKKVRNNGEGLYIKKNISGEPYLDSLANKHLTSLYSDNNVINISYVDENGKRDVYGIRLYGHDYEDYVSALFKMIDYYYYHRNDKEITDDNLNNTEDINEESNISIIPKKILTLVNKVNELINKSLKLTNGEGIGIFDPSSTWQEEFVYLPIEVEGSKVIIKNKNQRGKENTQVFDFDKYNNVKSKIDNFYNDNPDADDLPDDIYSDEESYEDYETEDNCIFDLKFIAKRLNLAIKQKEKE